MTWLDRSRRLTTPEDVDVFLRTHPTAAVFKIGECHQTDEALARMAPHLESRPELPLATIRVVEARAASSHLAARSGVRHESPQLLLFRDGRLAWARDRWNITGVELAAALSELGTAVAPQI